MVVYAPRRGILEVWKMRHGPRLAILDVGMGGRLLNSHAGLGQNAAIHMAKLSPARCYFLSIDGQLKEVVIVL